MFFPENELEKCKANIKTRIGTLQDLKYNLKEVMTEKDKKESAVDAYTEQLEEQISKFGAVIFSLERAIQLLADSEEVKSKRREDQKQEVAV